MKNLLIVFFFTAFCAPLFAQEEYTIVCRGDIQGTIIVSRDNGGKVTITAKMTKPGLVYIDNALCPLIPLLPKWMDNPAFYMNNRLSVYNSCTIVIDGNTTTETYPGIDGGLKTVIQGNTVTKTRLNSTWWGKIVVQGNTVTETYSNGHWSKTVVEGGTTTKTYPKDVWHKWVTRGNVTTHTNSYGEDEYQVVEGNTTTFTDKNGNWEKYVVDGNTETSTWSNGRWEKRIVEREGNIIIITKQSGQR